mgnify:FL=1|tara:strand:+ start:1715 stop:2362 length:648 start_codon:yes stop_codon:yes gene_type:complete
MKHFVITIIDNDKSHYAADKCVESGKKFGLEIDYYEAFTPHTCFDFISEHKINTERFNNSQYSREHNAMAAFCSHLSLWMYSLESNEEITIFEHDAVIMENIPNIDHNGCISFGKPSYGKFNTPMALGRNRLVSKPYFPGAHAYRIKPNAAKIMVETGITRGAPTDIFLNIETFPWLEEFYPWPVEVKETFTTIQKETGCQAKHMYNENYVIEEV